MTHAKSLLITVLGAALCVAASAQAAPKAPLPPGTVVTLPVTASVQVANDQAVVEMYVLEQAAELGEATNKAVERAARGISELKAAYPQAQLQTQSLSSVPRYAKAAEGAAAAIVGWEVRQSVSARISDVEQAAAFVQNAQRYFAFSRVGFQLSPQSQQAVQEKLVRDALHNMKQQARLIAETMAGKRARVSFESVEFHNAAYERPVTYRANSALLAAKSSAGDGAGALPVFEAGETTLTRSLTAKLRIKPAPEPKKQKNPTPPEKQP